MSQINPMLCITTILIQGCLGLEKSNCNFHQLEV